MLTRDTFKLKENSSNWTGNRIQRYQNVDNQELISISLLLFVPEAMLT